MAGCNRHRDALEGSGSSHCRVFGDVDRSHHGSCPRCKECSLPSTAVISIFALVHAVLHIHWAVAVTGRWRPWRHWGPWESRECRLVLVMHSGHALATRSGLRADSLEGVAQVRVFAQRQDVVDPSRTGCDHRLVSLYGCAISLGGVYVASEDAKNRRGVEE